MADDLALDVEDRDLIFDRAEDAGFDVDLEDRDLVLDPADGDVAVEFRVIGSPGPRGLKGDKGDKGDTGAAGAARTVTFAPPFAQATWLVPHDLGRPPAIHVILPDGEAVGFRTVNLDDATVSIEFAFPTSGTAYLS